MKSLLLRVPLFLLCIAFVSAEPPGIDQSLEFVTPPTGKKFIRWHGKPGRTYFVMVSDPADHLKIWHFAPIIESGNGQDISYEVDGTADKGFFRLIYTDEPTTDPYLADFDGDGVSNIDEITILGTNPFLFATNGGTIGDGAQDWDGDGISNADEVALGLDPGVNNTAPAAGAGTVGYAYDDAHRLIGMTAPVSSETFSPDAEGNLQ